MQIRDIEALVNSEKGFVPVPQEGMRSPSIIKDASFGISDGERLSGFAICEEVDAHNIMLSSLYIRKGITSIAFAGLLGRLKKAILEKYDNDEEGAYLTEVASVTDTRL